MAAPAVSSSTKVDGSSSPLTLNAPSGLTDGDLILVWCHSDESASGTADFAISGFTEVFAAIKGGTTAGASGKLLQRVASGEGASWSVSRTGGSGNWGAIAIRVTHASGTPVIDTSNTSTSASDEGNTPALTTGAHDCLVIRGSSWNESKTLSAIPSGTTAIQHNDLSSNDGHTVYDTDPIVTAGASVAAKLYDLSSATQTAGFTISIKPPANNDITRRVLAAGGSAADQNSYDTASIDPAANKLITVAVQYRQSASVTTPTISGCGLTWVLEEANDGASSGVSVFRAMGSSPSTGALTIDFAGNTQLECNWSVIEWSGVDTSGTNGSGAIVQSVDVTASGTTTGATCTLAAFGSADNVAYGAIGRLGATGAITPADSFVEINEVSNGSTLQDQYKSENDNTIVWSWGSTSNVFRGVGIEIKKAQGSTTTQTIDGKARITAVTARTILGRARVTATTLRTILGRARVTKAASQTILGRARVTATTARTITGLANIYATTSRTILGRARVTATTSRTVQGFARITKSVAQTITGLARVTASTSRTVLGRARITATTTQTVTGLSRIEKAATQTITGLAKLTVSTSQTILGKARVTVSTSRMIMGLARVTTSAAQTILGKARITATTSQTVQGLARITVSVVRTALGRARIEKAVLQTILGRSRITAAATQTIAGRSRITALATRTILGLARITVTTVRTITGMARIEISTSQTIEGKANIANDIVTQRTIQGMAYIIKGPWYQDDPTVFQSLGEVNWQESDPTPFASSGTANWQEPNPARWQR